MLQSILIVVNHCLENLAIITSSLFLFLKLCNLSVHPSLTNIRSVSKIRVVRATYITIVTSYSRINPARGLGNISIDSRSSIFTTANTPGNNTSLDISVGVIFGGTDKRTSSISLASVFTIDSTSTEEGKVQFEFLSKSGSSKLVLTLSMVYNWQVNLLQNHLVLSGSSKLILAPSSSKACGSIKHLIWIWQTSSVNVLIKKKILTSEEDSIVILKVSSIKFWMNDKVLDISILMRVGFSLVLGVPLSTSDLQF